MPVDKTIAAALGDAVGEFVNKWISDNHGGLVSANDVLSMLATHAGRVIQLAPDAEHRAHLLGEFVGALVEFSEAPVAVSIFRCPALENGPVQHPLATVKPAGSA